MRTVFNFVDGKAYYETGYDKENDTLLPITIKNEVSVAVDAWINGTGTQHQIWIYIQRGYIKEVA